MSNCTVFIRNIFLKDMSVGYDITYKYINPKVNNLDNINPEYLFKERARAARVRKIFVLSIIYLSTRIVTKDFFLSQNRKDCSQKVFKRSIFNSFIF